MALLLTILSLTTLVTCSVVHPSPGDSFELLILHNNDMHARFEQTSQLSGICTPADRQAGKCYGGFPRVAHVVKEARRAAASGEGPPVLYLNAGDTYTGTAWFTIYKWRIAAEFLNALQPDAVSLGNHEFDQGVMGVTPFIQNLTCPVLAANLILTKVPELEKERNLKKSIVIMVHGVKIGIVGYLTPDTKTTARPNDVEYMREVDAINDEVKVLNSKGVKIIIALGHSGYVTDMEIAREVEGVDLVVGGHTNTFLWNGTTPDSEEIIGPYPTYVKQKSGRMVPVVQAYAYTKYLGKLLIKFDHRGEVLNIKGNPILLDNTIPQDPEVLTIIERYRTKTLAYDEVIGNTSVILDGRSCNQRECNLGNMITDAIIDHYAKQYTGEHWTDTPIAIMQAGAIRSSIANTKLPHAITKGDILQAMPFDKPLALMTVNASVLLKMLEHAVADYHNIDGPREFLQFSGLKVVYNVKHPPGDRVVSAMARCWNCDIPAYQPIKMGEIYKVIMPDIVALGGDGYDMLPGLPTEILNYNELICTERYVRRHSPVYPEIEGRIIIINEDLHKDTGTNIYPSLHYLMLIKLVMYFF